MKIKAGEDDRKNCRRKLNAYIAEHFIIHGYNANPEEHERITLKIISDLESGAVDKIPLNKNGFDSLSAETIDHERVIRAYVDGNYFEWVIEGER